MRNILDLTFSPAAVDAGDGARLAQAMRDEIAIMYDGLDLDGDTMPKAGAAELGPPGGAFLVGYAEGVAVCCGGERSGSDRRRGAVLYRMPISELSPTMKR
ncbi:MAG TPA: hypothetical protein VE571_08130 [Solirubrobacteraceae bacterium]|nr:hypothetical protein [Solirubrobacteraceae bacterium]